MSISFITEEHTALARLGSRSLGLSRTGSAAGLSLLVGVSLGRANTDGGGGGSIATAVAAVLPVVPGVAVFSACDPGWQLSMSDNCWAPLGTGIKLRLVPNCGSGEKRILNYTNNYNTGRAQERVQ